MKGCKAGSGFPLPPTHRTLCVDCPNGVRVVAFKAILGGRVVRPGLRLKPFVGGILIGVELIQIPMLPVPVHKPQITSA